MSVPQPIPLPWSLLKTGDREDRGPVRSAGSVGESGASRRPIAGNREAGPSRSSFVLFSWEGESMGRRRGDRQLARHPLHLVAADRAVDLVLAGLQGDREA